MKGVFSALPLLLFLIMLLNACTIPSATFEFINSNSTENVSITPSSGQDWEGFTLTPGQTKSIESENSNLFFTALVGTQNAEFNMHYTYDSSTRTYEFNDYS